MRKILGLLTVNILLLTLSVGILDFFNIINYRVIFSKLSPFHDAASIKVEDPLLLEETELSKKWELLNVEKEKVALAQASLEEDQKALETEKLNLDTEWKNLENLRIQTEKDKTVSLSYEDKVIEVAKQIKNIPPEDGARLLAEQEDAAAVDILRKLDRLYEDEGVLSTVPYLLSLMESEKAGRIQALMLE